jgi:hypothetical protein
MNWTAKDCFIILGLSLWANVITDLIRTLAG